MVDTALEQIPQWAMEKARETLVGKEDIWDSYYASMKGQTAEAIARALVAERERAARTADDAAPVTQDWRSTEIADKCEEIAAVIRKGE